MTAEATTGDSEDLELPEEQDAEAALNEFEHLIEDRVECRIYESSGREYLILETEEAAKDTLMVGSNQTRHIPGNKFMFERSYVHKNGKEKLWFRYIG